MILQYQPKIPEYPLRGEKLKSKEKEIFIFKLFLVNSNQRAEPRQVPVKDIIEGKKD